MLIRPLQSLKHLLKAIGIFYLFSISHFAWGTTNDNNQKLLPAEMATRMQACTACHGVNGEGNAKNTYFPRISGQPTEYLYQQLIAFRHHKRIYGPMNYLPVFMDNAYLHKIAEYFSDMPANSSIAPTRAMPSQIKDLNLAKQLIYKGDSARGIPACTACHGQQLAGQLPAIPGILGFSEQYLSAQLGAFHNGVRHAKEPNCMKEVVTSLNQKDISALSSWLAAQPLPDHIKPMPASNTPLPIACGSQTK